MTLSDDLAASLVGVVVLAVVATLVLALFRVPRLWEPAVAIVRGAAQLAVISVILTGIVSSPNGSPWRSS